MNINYNPLVSVIINCHNSEKFLTECLNSVFIQKYTNWEIILLDNASVDKTKHIAKSFGSKLKYYSLKSKVSLGEARNLAIKKAKGELIAFLDSDDLWLKDKLFKQVKSLESNNIHLSYTDVLYFNETKGKFRLYSKIKSFDGFCFPHLLDNFFLCLSSVVIKKSQLKKLDHFFDNKFNVVEEADLFLRLSLNSNFIKVDQVLAKYRIHKDALTSQKYHLNWKERDMLLKKLESLFPNLKKKYLKNFINWDFGTKMTKVHYLMLRGNKMKARLILKNLEKSLKVYLLFFLTFFPGSIIKLLFRLKGNYR